MLYSKEICTLCFVYVKFGYHLLAQDLFAEVVNKAVVEFSAV